MSKKQQFCTCLLNFGTFLCRPLQNIILKAMANEDTLLRTRCCPWCFLGCANWETFVADTKCFKMFHFLCPGHKICVRYICCARGQPGKLCVRNNVSSFARALASLLPIWFLPSSGLCLATLFSLEVRHTFLKELAIAKAANHIWTWIRSPNSFTVINIVHYILLLTAVPGLVSLVYHRSSHMNYFIFTSRHFTPHGRYELNKFTSLPMCGFIAQLVEHHTGIRIGHGFETRWTPDFFGLLLSCDDYCSLCYRLLSIVIGKVVIVCMLIIDTMLSAWFCWVTQSSKHAMKCELNTNHFLLKNLLYFSAPVDH